MRGSMERLGDEFTGGVCRGSEHVPVHGRPGAGGILIDQPIQGLLFTLPDSGEFKT